MPDKTVRDIPIFVYGTLRKDWWNHRFIENADFIDNGVTKDRYIMHAHAYPMLSRKVQDTHIIGEYYLISKKEFATLDRLEGYPDHYDRARVDVRLTSGDVVNAWVYFNDDIDGYGYGTAHVPSGDFADHAEAA